LSAKKKKNRGELQNRNILFVIVTLNGMMKFNLDEVFILYFLKSSSLFPL